MMADKKAAPGANRTAASRQPTSNFAHCSPLDNLLSRCTNVKQTGPGRYKARCANPEHDDKSPSMTIRETDDGRLLIHCFAGCSVHEIVRGLGLELSDLFPRNPGQHCKPERRPFPAADVLKAIGYEALVVCAAAVTMLSGEPFTQLDRDRLMLAAERIQAGLTAAGVSHDAR